MSIVITGKVRDVSIPGVKPGDTLKLSFLAESTPLVREIEEQGIVQDGIAPYKVCDEDFSLKTSSGLSIHLGPMPVDPLDGTVSSLWFSVQKERPVYDGAWLSTEPVDAKKGIPLTIHPLRPTGATAAAKTTWGGVFSLFFKGKTWPSLSLPADIGTYTAHSVVGSTLEIWKDWDSNVVLSCDFDQMQVSKASYFG